MNDLADGLSFVLTQNIAKININTEITEEIANDFIDLLYGLEFINSDNSLEAVIISISSPGGLVTDGFAMYSALKMSSLPIYIINTGIVASIAGIIFLGVEAKNRFAFENSLFMIHNAHGGDDEVVLNKINKSLESILGTVISPAYLQSLMDAETWMDINEQILYNIIIPSNIIKVTDEFDISKLLNTNATEKNIFNIYNKIIKNNETEMSKNILEKLKALKNSILNNESDNQEQEVIANATEVVSEVEQVVESIEEEQVSDISENLINHVEEIDTVEESGDISEEQPIVKTELEILMEELSFVKMKLSEKENELAEIENSKKLKLKMDFLAENKIEATSVLLELEYDKLKSVVDSIKVNKIAPSVVAPVSKISNNVKANGLHWNNMTDIERTELANVDRELFNKLFSERNKK